MKRKLFLAVLVLILAVFLSGCDLNLKGQERFTVDGYVYGLVMTEEWIGYYVRIGLMRVGRLKRATSISSRKCRESSS